IVLAPAEAMNLAAANALFKSLEEPGSRTQFLLLADVPSRLLATIRSRCQHWELQFPERTQRLAWLEPRQGCHDEAELWFHVAGWRPLLAVELEAPEARALRQQLHETFDALVRGAEPVAEAARLDRHALESILWYGIAWLEDLIRLGLSGV